jgi:hypothetical protein
MVEMVLVAMLMLMLNLLGVVVAHLRWGLMRHLRLVAMVATERLQLFQGRPQLMLVEVVAGSAHQLGLLGLAVRAEAEQASKELE